MGPLLVRPIPAVLAAVLGVGAGAFAYRLGGDAGAALAVGLGAFAALLAVANELVRGRQDEDLALMRADLDAARADVEQAQARALDLATALEAALSRGVADAAADTAVGARRRHDRAIEALEARAERADERLRRIVEAVSAAVDAAAGIDPEAAGRAGAALAAAERLEPAPSDARRAEPPRFDAAPRRMSESAPATLHPRPGRPFGPELAEARFDVSLQPVIALADREPRFFDLMADWSLDPKPEPAALIVKAAAVAKRLAAAGQSTPVICPAGMARLREDAWLRHFLAFASDCGGLGAMLRLEFTQAELDIDSARDLAILQRLRAKGFGFALAGVRDLGIDIGRLSRAGFRSVRLEAAMLLERERGRGEPGVGEPGVIERLVGALDKAGLELVVDGLDDIDTARAIRLAGARLGQGEAIAPPRVAMVERAWLDAGAPTPTAEAEPTRAAAG